MVEAERRPAGVVRGPERFHCQITSRQAAEQALRQRDELDQGQCESGDGQPDQWQRCCLHKACNGLSVQGQDDQCRQLYEQVWQAIGNAATADQANGYKQGSDLPVPVSKHGCLIERCCGQVKRR